MLPFAISILCQDLKMSWNMVQKGRSIGIIAHLMPSWGSLTLFVIFCYCLSLLSCIQVHIPIISPFIHPLYPAVVSHSRGTWPTYRWYTSQNWWFSTPLLNYHMVYTNILFVANSGIINSKSIIHWIILPFFLRDIPHTPVMWYEYTKFHKPSQSHHHFYGWYVYPSHGRFMALGFPYWSLLITMNQLWIKPLLNTITQDYY